MTGSSEYTPPKVWTWNKANGGTFANINRPVSGATHEKELPVGKHPLQLYSLATPNGVKVTVMLEELLARGHAGETKRQLDVLDRRLAETEYLAGSDYTIADIAVWPWYGGLVKGRIYDAAEFLQVQDYKNVLRWADAIDVRPAVKRGRMVNRTSGEPSDQLHERHDAADFDKLAGRTELS